MPTYLDPLAGVSLSEAAAEAAVIAPIARAMLDTLEFSRSTFVDAELNPVAPRVVIDKQDLLATLEADAPLNGGEEVLFRAVGLRIVKPPENESGQSPTFQIEIDGVSGLVLELLDEDMESDEPTVMIHRVYASDDTSGPAVLPVLRMEVLGAVIGETSVRLTCGFLDPLNTGFPSVAYTRRLYPGLAAR